MGLDMYLEAQRFSSDVDFSPSFHARIKPIITPEAPPGDYSMISITTNVAHWWKANAIHGWFVTNVQNNVDDCNSYRVTVEQLQSLVGLCRSALETKDPTSLPPRSGFFFGSTTINSHYWQNLQDTIDQLQPIITWFADNPKIASHWMLQYRASW